MQAVHLTVSAEMRAALVRRLPGVSTADLEVRLVEFLRFVQLAASLDAQRLPIGVELDEVWHAYILETRAYASLCAQAGRFVHHTAIPQGPIDGASRSIDDDLAFVSAYLKHFGDFPEPAITLWPALARLSAHLRQPLDAVLKLARGLAEEAGDP